MWEVYASESARTEVIRAARAFVGPLVPFRVASYVLRLVLLLLALLLAALVEHLFEELELCEGNARQRAYQG